MQNGLNWLVKKLHKTNIWIIHMKQNLHLYWCWACSGICKTDYYKYWAQFLQIKRGVQSSNLQIICHICLSEHRNVKRKDAALRTGFRKQGKAKQKNTLLLFGFSTSQLYRRHKVRLRIWSGKACVLSVLCKNENRKGRGGKEKQLYWCCKGKDVLNLCNLIL